MSSDPAGSRDIRSSASSATQTPFAAPSSARALGSPATTPAFARSRRTATFPSPDNPWMKIALVILHADPARGGAERYTVDLATALHARGGVDVTLVASTFGPQEI